MPANRPPTTRHGRTSTVKVGKVTLELTVNRDAAGNVIELFGKADEGEQGHVEMVAKLASLGLQNRGDIRTVIRHLRGDRTPPCGSAGQPTSIYDAMARVLQGELDGKGKEATERQA